MNPADTNPRKSRQFREHDAVWEAFAPLAERITGITGRGARNALLNQLIRKTFDEHGTPDERAIVTRADAEMEVRKRDRSRFMRGAAGQSERAEE